MSVIKRARAWLRDRVHVVNHNSKPSGPDRERHGSPLVEGTAHIHTAGWRDLARISWAHGRRAGAGALLLTIDSGTEHVTLSVGVPGARYWFTIEQVPGLLFEILPMNYRRSAGARKRSLGVKLHSGAAWLSVWGDDHEHRHDDPWWMSARMGLDDVADALFGKVQYSTEVLEVRDVGIPMPEGLHHAKATRSIARWIRPRWPWGPFSHEIVRVNLDIPGGIETDHKGPLFALSMRARTIGAAIGEVVADAFERRGSFVAPPMPSGPGRPVAVA